ncbi:MAG: DUF1641 domain-containing protein [Desulfovibrionales bacterium]
MADNAEIIARLDRLEAMLAPVAETSRTLQDLQKELPPQAGESLRAMVKALSGPENEYRVEDLGFLAKKGLQSINNLTFALDQLDNVIEFLRTAEPLLKVTIPAIIETLDRLERQGLFAMGLGLLEALERVSERHDPQEMARLGDVLSVVLDAGCRLTTPESLKFLEQALSAPSRVDLDKTGEVTITGLFRAMRDPRIRQGLGVLLELTRALAPSETRSCPLPPEPQTQE